jgi:preprotein translocase subunit YajC
MISSILFILLQADGGGEAAPEGFGGMQFVFFIGILAVFYFFMIRPQQKRAKEEKKFREGLDKGDKVVSVGGIYGTIESMDEATVLLRVDQNTKLRMDKSSLRAVPSTEEAVKK